ncbi:hypothetical protein OH77DRAFT_922909 [Trametes cingulata]|nr:hypothetical protein OH77DRAFT_922909 [Trametes cingulata]
MGQGKLLKRCNDCNLPLEGRHTGKLHGEATGHDWQPMIACTACHKSFRREKQYNAHIPTCRAHVVVPTPHGATAPLVDDPRTAGFACWKCGAAYDTLAALIHHTSRPACTCPLPNPELQEATENSASAFTSTGTGNETPHPSAPPEFSKFAKFESGEHTGTRKEPAIFNDPCEGERTSNALALLPPCPTAEIDKPAADTKGQSLQWHCRACLREPCIEPVATFCGHIFCRCCIMEGLRNHFSCPYCKRVFLIKLDVKA